MTKTLTETKSVGLLEKVGARYGLDPKKLYETICKTVFRDAQNQEQVIALLVVADQYKLNPFTREIYAFPDRKGGIVPVVGVDGWLRMINDHPQFAGLTIQQSDDLITMTYEAEGERGEKVERESTPAPEWMECTIYRRDREHHAPVREYLHEVYRNTDPWNKTTSRMLRHKTIIQAARVTFGFGGIKDPDEAERIREFDIEGTCTEETTVALLGEGDWKKLVKAGLRAGYTEEDILASAAVAGHSGPGPEISAALADRLYAAMRAHPKLEVDEDGQGRLT